MRDITDGDGAILRLVMHAQPGQVVADEGRAGDHPEELRAQARDGQIGLDAAAGIEELGVGGAAHRLVHIGIRHPLQQRQGTRAADLDLAEGGQIEEGHALAGGLVFLADAIEVRRLVPAPLALIGAGAAPRLTGLEVVDALPAKLLTEDRTQFLQPGVDRADAVRARPLVLIIGEAQAIVVLDALAGALGRVVGAGIVVAEARGAEGIDIQRGLAFDDPLGHELADAARAAVAIERHAGRDPHAARARHRAQHGLAIRRVRARVADQRDDAGLLEERDAADGTFQQLLKAIKVRREELCRHVPTARHRSSAPADWAHSRR